MPYLGAVIAERLYQLIPEADEGVMSVLRSALVRSTALSRVAKSINLSGYLYLGRGEESGGGRQKTTNLAAALEAVIAAVFLDSGWSAAKDFILRLFDAELKKAISRGIETNYKTQLQQVILSRQQEVPVYRITETSGPPHNRKFTAEVLVNDEVLGRGNGRSKKNAETEAARSALEKLV